MLPPWFHHRRWAPLILMAAMTGAHSGDISPLVLPNQRQVGNIRPLKAETDKKEQYYTDFRRDMRVRTPAERDALAIEFKKRLEASRTDPERIHYQRLLTILVDIQSAGASR